MTDIAYQFQTSLDLQGIRDVFSSPSDTIEQANSHFFRNVQQIGTTEELLGVGDVATPGVCVFYNLSAIYYVEIGTLAPGGGLPANSELRIAADGTPYLQNVTNSLWYPFQVDGPDGNVYMETGQTGVSLPVPTGTFTPFLKLKPGERQLCRTGVSSSALYAKADTGNVELLYIIYDD